MFKNNNNIIKLKYISPLKIKIIIDILYFCNKTLNHKNKNRANSEFCCNIHLGICYKKLI